MMTVDYQCSKKLIDDDLFKQKDKCSYCQKFSFVHKRPCASRFGFIFQKKIREKIHLFTV